MGRSGSTTAGPPGTRQHVVELYDSDLDLAKSVHDFLAHGLQGDGAVLVVATEPHRLLFDGALRDAGVDLDAAEASGRFVALDASEALELFPVPEGAVPARFDAGFEALISQLITEHGSIRIYGEMVAVLWAAGNVSGAIALEDAWNHLVERQPLELLCSYPRSLFDDDEATSAFERMCRQHTSVVPVAKVRSEDEARRTIARLEQRVGATVADRDALEAANRRLEQQLARLEDHDHRRSEFVAMVVHDIRMPTAIVTGFLHVLRQNWTALDGGQIDDFLERGIHAGKQIERLAGDVLTVAELDGGRFVYELADVDLGAIVSQAAMAMRAATGADVDVRVPPDLPQARADDVRQLQILHNLISNAVKFSPADAPVVVTIEERATDLRVSVIDQGPGITPAEAGGLFRPFARAAMAERRKVKGTGLGLYITKSLVEGQGGTITLRNNGGGGSTFSYTVPLASLALGPVDPDGPADPLDRSA